MSDGPNIDLMGRGELEYEQVVRLEDGGRRSGEERKQRERLGRRDHIMTTTGRRTVISELPKVTETLVEPKISFRPLTPWPQFSIDSD